MYFFHTLKYGFDIQENVGGTLNCISNKTKKYGKGFCPHQVYWLLVHGQQQLIVVKYIPLTIHKTIFRAVYEFIREELHFW